MRAILTTEQRNLLLAEHRTERDRRRANRIKAVLLRDDGWSYEHIAAALFLSDEGVRRQIKDYLKKNKPEEAQKEFQKAVDSYPKYGEKRPSGLSKQPTMP